MTYLNAIVPGVILLFIASDIDVTLGTVIARRGTANLCDHR